MWCNKLAATELSRVTADHNPWYWNCDPSDPGVSTNQRRVWRMIDQSEVRDDVTGGGNGDMWHLIRWKPEHQWWHLSKQCSVGHSFSWDRDSFIKYRRRKADLGRTLAFSSDFSSCLFGYLCIFSLLRMHNWLSSEIRAGQGPGAGVRAPRDWPGEAAFMNIVTHNNLDSELCSNWLTNK